MMQHTLPCVTFNNAKQRVCEQESWGLSKSPLIPINKKSAKPSCFEEKKKPPGGVYSKYKRDRRCSMPKAPLASKIWTHAAWAQFHLVIQQANYEDIRRVFESFDDRIPA